MRQNIGSVDRTIRTLVGLGMSMLGIFRLLKRRRNLALILIGLGLFTGGLLGYCISYDLMGISTTNSKFVETGQDLELS
ncbi:MAG: DUF2892 domain-containing protein [Firmicutes bacterium]|nr:DUF2892 domain-containing protein [Bacillota bacterium]